VSPLPSRTRGPLRPAFDPRRPHEWERFRRGEPVTGHRPGDFLLSHRTWHPFSVLIRLGQRLRIHGDDHRDYCHWSHAALVTTDGGALIEMQAPGAVRGHVDDYLDLDCVLVRVHASDEDRTQAVEFAEWCIAERRRIGRAAFFSFGLSCLTGTAFTFFQDGSMVCSTLVARAQERTGAIFNRDPNHIAPADLAKYYGVRLEARRGPAEALAAGAPAATEEPSSVAPRPVRVPTAGSGSGRPV